MSTIKIKNIIKNYAKELKKQNYPFSHIYLFGSYAKNTANQNSDIDVAVISDRLKKNWSENEIELWRLRRNIDSRIQPIGFTNKDFQNTSDPMVYEIKKYGIRII